MRRLNQPSNLLDSDDDFNDRYDEKQFNRNSNRFMKGNQNNFQQELNERVKSRQTPSPKEIETDSEVEIDASNDYDTKDTFGLQTGFMNGSTWRNKNSSIDMNSVKRPGKGLYKQDKLIEEKENDFEYDSKPPIKSRSLKRNTFEDDDFDNDRSVGRWDMQKKQLRSKQNDEEPEDKFEDWSNSLKSNSSYGRNTKKPNEPKRRSMLESDDDADNDDEIKDPFSSKSSNRFMKSKKSNQNKELNSSEQKPRKERSKTQLNRSIYMSDSDNEEMSFGRKSKARDSSDFELNSSSKFIHSNNQNTREIDDPYLSSKSNRKERDNKRSLFEKDSDESDERFHTGQQQQQLRNSNQKSRNDSRRTASGDSRFKRPEGSDDEYSPRNKPSSSMKHVGSERQKEEERKRQMSNKKSPRMNDERQTDKLRGSVTFKDSDEDRSHSKGKHSSRSLERPISPDTSMCEEIEVDESKSSKPDQFGSHNGDSRDHVDGDIKPHTEVSKVINNGISGVAGSQTQTDRTIPPRPITKDKKKKDKYKYVTPRVSTFTNLRSISMSNLTGRNSDDGFGKVSSARPYGEEDDAETGFNNCQSIREAAFINWYLSKKRDGKLSSSRQKQLDSMTEEEKAEEELRRKKEKADEGKRAYEAWMKEKSRSLAEEKRKKKDTNKGPDPKDRKSAETAFDMWKKQKEIAMKEEAKKKKEKEKKEKDKIHQEKEEKLRSKKEKDKELKAKNDAFHQKEKEKKEQERKAKEEKEREIEKKKEEAVEKYFQWEMKIEDTKRKRKEEEKKNQKLMEDRKHWRPNSAKVAVPR